MIEFYEMGQTPYLWTSKRNNAYTISDLEICHSFPLVSISFKTKGNKILLHFNVGFDYTTSHQCRRSAAADGPMYLYISMLVWSEENAIRNLKKEEKNYRKLQE